MIDMVGPQESGSIPAYKRLHYLDWLRVLAILMVFLFHAVHPFDFDDWHIKNVEQSEIITIFILLLGLWGMPFFFLVSGAASWFALRRRTAGQYLSERFKRLLVPFFVGTLLFRPFVTYLEWMNRSQRGLLDVPFMESLNLVANAYLSLGFSPGWFGLGEHLWFLGFLFSFALITLPLFLWLKQEAGRRIISKIAGLCEHRGGLLLFILPLAIVQFSVRPFFPGEHDWADFAYQMAFFALGYILFSDERFTRTLRRDWWLLLALGTAIVLSLLGMYALGLPVVAWGETPSMPHFYVLQGIVTALAFCYTLTMIFVGMRFLDFTNKWLRYAQEAVLPFFVVHQPVILVIAFFVVQWTVGIPLKLLTVVSGSFVVCIALYELIIRRIRPLRLLFGMKARIPDRQPAGAD